MLVVCSGGGASGGGGGSGDVCEAACAAVGGGLGGRTSTGMSCTGVGFGFGVVTGVGAGGEATTGGPFGRERLAQPELLRDGRPGGALRRRVRVRAPARACALVVEHGWRAAWPGHRHADGADRHGRVGHRRARLRLGLWRHRSRGRLGRAIVVAGGRDRDADAHERERAHRHGHRRLAATAGDGLGCRGCARRQADRTERSADARSEIAGRLGHGQRAIAQRGLAQCEQCGAAVRAAGDVTRRARLAPRPPACRRHRPTARAAGPGRAAPISGSRSSRMQAQARRADEARYRLLLGAERRARSRRRDGPRGRAGPAPRAPAARGAGWRRRPRPPTVQGATRGLSAALVGQRTCRRQQVRGHVERLEAVLGEVRERAGKRELDERRGGAVVARQTMTETVDAALVGAIEQFERPPVAALHAADQRPGLAQFALARLLPGDRHRLVNPS